MLSDSSNYTFTFLVDVTWMVQSFPKGFTLQLCRDRQLRLIPKLFAKYELFKHQNI